MSRWGPPLLALSLTVVVWEVVVVGFRVPEYLLPTPSGIAGAMVSEWRYLALHTAVTLYEILWGFGLAIAVGIPLAMLIVYSPLFERSVYPILVASQSVPKIAIAPLLIFWAGLGIFPKVLVAFAVSFFPVVIDTVVGLRAVEPEMLHLARSMGVQEDTARRYLDVLTGSFMVRQLQPWFLNTGKRLVKSPKTYFRDSGLLHSLLGLKTLPQIQAHPKLGFSWEGFALEEVIRIHYAH